MRTDAIPCEVRPRHDRRIKIDLNRFRTHLRIIWAIWLAGVIWGSLISGGRLSSLEQTLPFLEYDKLMHFSAYAGLATLSLLAFEGRRGIAVALSMILLGGLIELAQSLSPGRTPDIADAITNALGVFAGLAFGLFLTRYLVRSRHTKPTGC